MSRFSSHRIRTALKAIARFFGKHFQRAIEAIGYPFRLALDFLQLGRIFRRLGLPLWTFIGIGAAGWWFDNAGILIETFINQLLGEESGNFAAYLAPLILFLIPFIVVIAIALWYRSRRQLENCDFLPQLQDPEGKKGIVLLVSRTDSALYAIRYHFLNKRTLERVWLLPSNNEEKEEFGLSSLPIAEEIKKECEKLSEEQNRSLEIDIYYRGVSPADAQDTFDIVNRIFRRYDGNPGEIVADFTGGTKPMSVGMIMACLPGDRELEYIAYNPSKRQMLGPFIIHYQHSAFDLVG